MIRRETGSRLPISAEIDPHATGLIRANFKNLPLRKACLLQIDFSSAAGAASQKHRQKISLPPGKHSLALQSSREGSALRHCGGGSTAIVWPTHGLASLPYLGKQLDSTRVLAGCKCGSATYGKHGDST